MSVTINDLKKGEKGIIQAIAVEKIPVKLLEMGCLPGNVVEFLEKAPLNDPIYIKIDQSYLSIRKDIAQHIQIEKI